MDAFLVTFSDTHASTYFAQRASLVLLNVVCIISSYPPAITVWNLRGKTSLTRQIHFLDSVLGLVEKAEQLALSAYIELQPATSNGHAGYGIAILETKMQTTSWIPTSMISLASSSLLSSVDDSKAIVPANFHDEPQSPSLRTLSAVREQVAQEIAMRTVNKTQVVDGVQTGVSFTFSSKKSSNADMAFLTLIASHIALFAGSKDSDYLFTVATSGLPPPDVPYNFILICSSDDDYIQRAIALISSKFVGRVHKVRALTPVASLLEVREVGLSSYDELALWDAVRKSARAPIDPLVPPPGSRSAERMLSDARAHLQRLTPQKAFEELRDPVQDGVKAPTFLVDIRDERERSSEGSISGAVLVNRNELEWKFDPRAPKGERLEVVDRYDLRVIVFDGDGRASSLAAYQLRELGMWNATDIVGGFKAWKNDGYPVHMGDEGTRLIAFEGLETGDSGLMVDFGRTN